MKMLYGICALFLLQGFLGAMDPHSTHGAAAADRSSSPEIDDTGVVSLIGSTFGLAKKVVVGDADIVLKKQLTEGLLFKQPTEKKQEILNDGLHSLTGKLKEDYHTLSRRSERLGEIVHYLVGRPELAAAKPSTMLKGKKYAQKIMALARELDEFYTRLLEQQSKDVASVLQPEGAGDRR